jgi:hypothetical protein
VRGFVALELATVVAVGGIYWVNGYWVAFLEGRFTKRALAEGWRKMRPIMENLGRPVFAQPAIETEGAETLLKHVGFEKEEELWVWRHGSRQQ